jgi:predicted  nucleic acid-binding Zn-ribbon protein
MPNVLLQNLLRLQSLEFDESREKNAEARSRELRGQIPAPILAHYDRLRVRGKKGVAVVRNQVCTGCHMRLPIGTINTLMQGQEIQLCETCGRYLYLPDAAESQFVENVAATKPETKPAAKPRKRKAAPAVLV